MKKIIKGITLFLFTGTILLSGCEKVPQMEFDSAAAAKEALDTAETLVLYSELYSSSRKTKILADGKVAGYIQGSTVYIDNEEWFHIDYVTDEPINHIDGVSSSTTYGYYDKDDNCLGYAQKRYLDMEDGRDQYLVFLDTDGSELPYFSSDDGQILYNEDGDPVGTGYTDRKAISIFEKQYTNVYRTVFDTDQTNPLSVDFMDRMGMYKCLQENMRRIYDEPVSTGVQVFETVVVIILILGIAIGTLSDKFKRK